VDTLIGIWPPADFDMSGFIEKNKEEGIIWDRAEGYFIHLTEPLSLISRLKVLQFRYKWDDNIQRCEEYYESILGIYNVINEDQYFFEMLGYFLAIGNVLNGEFGTSKSSKGQADGFNVDTVLGKVHTFKDNNGKSLMQYVCKKMKDKHPDFPDHIRKVLKIVSTRGKDIDTLKTICTEVETKKNAAMIELNAITTSGELRDGFMDKMEMELTIIEKKAAEMIKKKESIILKHEESVKFFGLKATDEIAKKSHDFLNIFADFFAQCEKALPVEEKKRGGKAVTKSSSSGGQGGGMASMADILAA